MIDKPQRAKRSKGDEMTQESRNMLAPKAFFFVAGALLGVWGAGCSRARVESMNLMNEGVQLAQQRQYVAAAEKLQQATSVDGSNDQAFSNLAMVEIEMHKYELAREALQKAIAVKADVAAYHEKLGTVLIELEDWKLARASLEEAIKRDPNLYKAYYKLGQVSERLDDPQNALRYYTKSIMKGPRLLEAYAALGRLYGDLGYVDQAKQVLEQALRVVHGGTEEEAEVHYLMGTVYHQQKRYQEAIGSYRRALGIVPSLRNALFSLGMAYVATGDREEAKRYLSRFVGMSGGAPAHYIQAAQSQLSELEGGA